MAKSNKKAPAKKPVAKPAKKTTKAATPATKTNTAKKIRLAPEGAKPAASSVANTTMYEIRSGNPIPPRRRGGGGVSPYPFSSMKVDDDIFIPHKVDLSKFKNEDEANTALKEETQRILNRMSGAVRRFTLKNPDFNFTVRAIEGGVGVWRIK